MARESWQPSLGGAGDERLGLAGFRRYYQTLRENLWLVLACVVVSTAIAGAYVVTAHKRYSAQAELLVSPAPASDTTLFALPVIHSTADPTRDVLTAASLVTTNQVAVAAVSKLRLKESAATLLADVQVSPIAQSNLLAVQAQGASPESAQRLANAVADQAVAVRTQALHHAIEAVLPGLRAQVAALPAAERNVPGTVGDQLNQLLQLRAGPDPTLAVASPAQLPTGPISPKTKLSLAAGLLGGLIIGIAAAFAWTALDPRIKREEQLKEILRVPILARIPTARKRAGGGPLTPEGLPHTVLEGYRTLRTMVSSRAGGKPQAYLMTGTTPAEGKTTTSMCLAVALAQGGARVVLIEADLRRPTIGDALDLLPHYGTDQVLIGEVPLSEALVSVRIDNTPLKVLACNRAGVDLADRLSFALARRLIDEAKRHADFVVIDSPPLTTVIDALPLAQYADEVIVVAKLGHSKVKKLIELEDLLTANGILASGSVLLGVDSRDSGYGYYLDNGDGGPTRRRRRGGSEGSQRQELQASNQ